MAPSYSDENQEGVETWSGALFILQFAAYIAPLPLAPFSQQITEVQASLPQRLVFEDCSIFCSLAW